MTRGARRRVVAQGGVAVEGGEVAEHLSRACEHDRMPVDDGLMGDISRQGGLADAVRADEDDVGGVFEEVERHQCFGRRTIAAFGPVPIEVA